MAEYDLTIEQRPADRTNFAERICRDRSAIGRDVVEDRLLQLADELDTGNLAGGASVTRRPSAFAVPEPYRPFPIDALPEPVRGFVANAADTIGCDPALVVLPLLAGLASAIGNTRRIRLKRGWTEPAIIWTATVGESGALKSPALDAALAPVRAADLQAGREHAETMQRYEQNYLKYEREVSRWKRARRNAGDEEPPEAPDRPASTRYEVADTTVEALAPILADNWRGVLLARDELAGWLCGFNQYKGGQGGDVAHWLKIWGGRDLKVDRKTGTPRTIRVPRAAVSICGTIQPGTLARALGVERFEEGMAARLLLAMPPDQVPWWSEAEADAALERQLAELFRGLHELRPSGNGEDEPEPVDVPLSREGKRAFVAWHDAHADETASLTGDLRPAYAKLKGYGAWLALILHFVRWVAGDPELTEPDVVDAADIRAGCALARIFHQF